jgi:transcriptional regulator with XRE-family HTH domain
MISKDKLLKHPNYLLSKLQAELYRQLTSYMEKHNLSQKKVAKKLGVSTSYVNQIINGNFNFTLKKLIELSLHIGMVPTIEFVKIEDYWQIEKTKENAKVVRRIAAFSGQEDRVMIRIPEEQLTSGSPDNFKSPRQVWTVQPNN